MLTGWCLWALVKQAPWRSKAGVLVLAGGGQVTNLSERITCPEKPQTLCFSFRGLAPSGSTHLNVAPEK